MLQRENDLSGISGIGVVAEGCVFESGEVALHWFGCRGSINIYHNLSDLEFIHHINSGDSKIIWLDDEKSSNKK